MAPSVTVFIDYQNAHITAHQRWCAYGEPLHACTIDPVRLAERLIEVRAPGGVLTAVRIYRGRADPRKEAFLTAATDRQAAAWSADERVTMLRRALKYPHDWGQPGCYERPREKGVDVELAVDLVRLGLAHKYEVAIVFSRDEDLIPALELAVDLPDTHIEVGTWEGASRIRLKYRELFCHKLSEDDFQAVRDPRSY